MTDDLYHYTESGLDTVWLRHGVTWIESTHGQAYAIADLDGLHKALGRALVRKRGSLTGREVRFLRTEMGMDLDLLAAQLGLCEIHSSALEDIEREGLHDLPVHVGIDSRARVLFTFFLMGCGAIEPGADWRWWMHAIDASRMVFQYTDDGWKLEEKDA